MLLYDQLWEGDLMPCQVDQLRLFDLRPGQMIGVWRIMYWFAQLRPHEMFRLVQPELKPMERSPL